jgi:hypothetical protein
MLRHVLGSFCFSFALLLAACGGSSDSSPAGGGSSTPASTTVNSSVVKGIIRNAVVTASRWQNGAYVAVASTTTDGAGGFSLTVPDAVPGEVLRLDMALSTDSGHPTQMLCDATQCGSASFGDWVTLTTAPALTSWIDVDGSGKLSVMAMTPVSTLLVRYAEDLGGGHLDTASLGMAMQRIAALFNMSPSDLMATPGNIASVPWVAAADPVALKLSLLSAAFAQLANDSSEDVDVVLKNFATAFISNNGRLLQAGSDISVASLFAAVNEVIIAAGATSTQDWANNVLAALQSGVLNPVPSGTGTFDSNAIVSALGTGTDTLGGDLRRVMQEQGVSSLQDLVAAQLAKFGWLASGDTTALAGIVVQSVLYAAEASVDVDYNIFPLTAANGLTPVLDSVNKILHITGTENGMAVDVTINLAPLFSTMVSSPTTAQFKFGVTGGVSNSRINAAIDGTLNIDATGTDFTALTNSIRAALLAMFYNQTPDMQAVATAVAGILKTGKATFTLNGSAGITNLADNSQLAVQGTGSLAVDMAGNNGAISAGGSVSNGSLTLPNGAVFSVAPGSESGDHLTFALGNDGTADAQFGVSALGHQAIVTGTGSIGALGPLLSNLRDGIATQLGSLTLDLNTLLAQALADAANLTLSASGQANITDLGHVYLASLQGGELKISQPNGSLDHPALDVTVSQNGMLMRAGGQWWLLNVNLSDLVHPVLTITDGNGDDWQWTYDFSGLVAAI